MAIKFTNNATSTLASGIASGDLSLTVASGQGALFPTLGGGDYFYVQEGATQAGAALGNIGAQQGQYDLARIALQNQIASTTGREIPACLK